MPPPLLRRPIPNVDTIETSLRSCSLSHTAHLAVDGLDPDITVDLNSEVPLPHPWEQFLNVQTGEIYYVNRLDGTKTNHHPLVSSSDSDSDPESAIDGPDNDSNSSDSNTFQTTTTTSTSSSAISTATSTASSSACSAAPRRPPSPVLVLVACNVCLTLSMVARPGTECAKCGSDSVRRF